MWPASLSLRLSVSSTLCYTNARYLADLYLSVAFVSFVTHCLETASQHVVLVGEFATSDWLFKEVREKLLQHDINITRPQNHVFIPPSLEINLVLTSYSGIRPYPMAPYHSISTTT